MTDHVSRARLLDILQSHGEQFLSTFNQVPTPKKRKRIADMEKMQPIKSNKSLEGNDTTSDDLGWSEEWTGIVSSRAESDEAIQVENKATAQERIKSPTMSGQRQPDVIIFSGATTTKSTQSRAQLKAFMSSKVSRLKEEAKKAEDGSHGDSDEADVIKNAKNDKLLHNLVHTQLLPSSLNPEMNSSSAQRRKFMEGRIVELAGGAKLGKGEKLLRKEEQNKHAKHVRDGLVEKHRKKQKQKLEDERELGNYHPIIKGLLDDSLPSASNWKRQRGLGMGIGTFKGGYLDIAKETVKIHDGVRNQIGSKPKRRKKTSRRHT